MKLIFIYRRVCTKNRFEKEAQGNSEIDYSSFFIYYLFLFLFLTGFGLECYSCSNKPEIYGGTKCESGKAENITCDPSLFNRCMTANYTMAFGPSGSTSIEIRNCSSSFACDPNSQWNSK